MKPSNTIVVSPKYIEEKERQIAELSKKVERLQDENKKLKEQIDEANSILALYFPKGKLLYSCCIKPLKEYYKKWGVK